MKGAPSPPLEINEPLGTDTMPAELHLTRWPDKLVESFGFGPRSMYVEMCYLPFLGPTATWAYRRLGSWAEFNPDGITVDTVELSRSMGLGESLNRSSKLGKTLLRLTQFDVARWVSDDELQVRIALAPLTARKVERLVPSSARLHEAYVDQLYDKRVSHE